MRALVLFLACILAASPVSAAVKVQEVTGKGGQKAWLIEDHSLPIVTVRMEIAQAGAAYDPEGKKGLANFAMQMMDEGAGDMNSLAFNQALESHAIRFGAEANEDSAVVSVQTLSEFKDNAFFLLGLALHKPRFDTDAVERVRDSIGSQIREVQNNPTYQASLVWKQQAFGMHPYHYPRLGTAETIQAIKRKDLQAFADATTACHPRILSVVGDMTVEDTKNLLSVLAPAAACPALPADIADATVAAGDEPVDVKIPVPQTVINASLPAVKRNDERYYAMVVLNEIFGGGIFTSRLGEEIRNKRGLAYYAESDVEELKHAAYISVHFATRSEQAQDAVNVFLGECRKMHDKGVTQAELDAAKRYIMGSFPLGLDSQGALAEYLTQMQRFHLGIDYLEKRNSFIQAVTLDQVNALAREIFNQKPLIVMAGPEKVGEGKK